MDFWWFWWNPSHRLPTLDGLVYSLFFKILIETFVKLKSLIITHNCFNRYYQTVPSELFLSLLKLEDCNLDQCNLNSEQITVMFRAILGRTDLNLKTLNMHGNRSNIYSLEPGLFKAVVNINNIILVSHWSIIQGKTRGMRPVRL